MHTRRAVKTNVERTMPWQDVSVCLSVQHTLVLCVNGYTYPQIFFTADSPTILVFPYQTGWQYSDGDPLTGASNARGYKNHDLRPILGFISELMQHETLVTMEGE